MHGGRPARSDGPGSPVRVAIIDDSLVTRAILDHLLDRADGCRLVGAFSGAAMALDWLAATGPDDAADIIILDLEMPGRSGLDALPDLVRAAPGVPILILSSHGATGAPKAVEALLRGASDTLEKPRHGAMDGRFAQLLRERLVSLATRPVRVPPPSGALAAADQDAATRSNAPPATPPATPSATMPAAPSAAPAGGPASPTPVGPAGGADAVGPSPDPPLFAGGPPALIGIGASTGGIAAIGDFLAALGPSVAIPILITQHLPPAFVPHLVRQLHDHAGRRVRMAQAGMLFGRGDILVAPGDRHLTVEPAPAARDGTDPAPPGAAPVWRVVLTHEPAPSRCMPSVDPMLASIADAAGADGCAVLLSGMGQDGVIGARRLAGVGGTVLAQSLDTATVWGMPGAVVRAGLARAVLSPAALASCITRAVVCAASGAVPGGQGATARRAASPRRTHAIAANAPQP